MFCRVEHSPNLGISAEAVLPFSECLRVEHSPCSRTSAIRVLSCMRVSAVRRVESLSVNPRATRGATIYCLDYSSLLINICFSRNWVCHLVCHDSTTFVLLQVLSKIMHWTGDAKLKPLVPFIPNTYILSEYKGNSSLGNCSTMTSYVVFTTGKLGTVFDTQNTQDGWAFSFKPDGWEVFQQQHHSVCLVVKLVNIYNFEHSEKSPF